MSSSQVVSDFPSRWMRLKEEVRFGKALMGRKVTRASRRALFLLFHLLHHLLLLSPHQHSAVDCDKDGKRRRR
jgi:formamidopyrimidine-DNA glycosylase